MICGGLGNGENIQRRQRLWFSINAVYGLGPKTINKTKSVYGFLGGMCEMMETILGRWIDTVMFRRTRYNVKNFTTSARQKKQKPLEGTILCDP